MPYVYMLLQTHREKVVNCEKASSVHFYIIVSNGQAMGVTPNFI